MSGPSSPSDLPPKSPAPIFPNLEAMTEHAFSNACEFITKSQKDYVQAMILEDGDGGLSYILTPWGSDAERKAMIRTLIRHLKKVNATRYVFVSEAWVAIYGPDEVNAAGDASPPRVQPSQHPRRREVLFASGVGKDGGRHHISANIITNDAGKRCIDERQDMSEVTSMGGQLTKLFEPDPWGEDFCTDETMLLKL
jgi:hypothetical protein